MSAMYPGSPGVCATLGTDLVEALSRGQHQHALEPEEVFQRAKSGAPHVDQVPGRHHHRHHQHDVHEVLQEELPRVSVTKSHQPVTASPKQPTPGRSKSHTAVDTAMLCVPWRHRFRPGIPRSQTHPVGVGHVTAGGALRRRQGQPVLHAVPLPAREVLVRHLLDRPCARRRAKVRAPLRHKARVPTRVSCRQAGPSPIAVGRLPAKVPSGQLSARGHVILQGTLGETSR
jgi:hypothetical protein